MTTYVSLLRGINVSGQKSIRMEQLRELYETLGFGDVRSYIQSGNVVFTAPETGEAELAEHISSAIRERFGHEVTILLRNSGELQRALEANPFPREAERDPKKVHVVFLDAEPESSAMDEISAVRANGEEIAVIGRELYLHLPHGAGRTMLSNALIEKKLKTPATARNWRTVTILAEMAAQTR